MMTNSDVEGTPGRAARPQGARPAWWKALRDTWAPAPTPVARVGVQHLILHSDEVEIVREALAGIGAAFGLRFDLASCDGEVVLLDADVVEHMSPPLVAAVEEGRPTVIVRGLRAGRGLASATRVAQVRQQLQQQLGRLPVVRERWSLRAAPRRAQGPMEPARTGSARDAHGPIRHGAPVGPGALQARSAVAPAGGVPDPGERLVLHRIAQGWRRLDTPPLVASYGAEAHLRFDFRTRQVLCDPKAMQTLCAQHEIPQPAAGQWPGVDACEHPLDLTVWHLGIASAGHPLASAPDDWWNAPMRASTRAMATAERCTRVPSQLDIVRRLADGPVTPASLRSQAQVSAADLRRVLQACLMLGLAHWVGPGQATAAA